MSIAKGLQESSRGGLEVERLVHIQLKVVTIASVDQIPLGEIIWLSSE